MDFELESAYSRAEPGQHSGGRRDKHISASRFSMYFPRVTAANERRAGSVPQGRVRRRQCAWSLIVTTDEIEILIISAMEARVNARLDRAILPGNAVSFEK